MPGTGSRNALGNSKRMAISPNRNSFWSFMGRNLEFGCNKSGKKQVFLQMSMAFVSDVFQEQREQGTEFTSNSCGELSEDDIQSSIHQRRRLQSDRGETPHNYSTDAKKLFT